MRSKIKRPRDTSSDPRARRGADVDGPDAILGFDATLRITFANLAATEIAAIPADSLVGRPIGDLADVPLIGAIAPALHEARISMLAQRVQIQLITHEVARWFDVWITTRPSNELFIFARDITDIKRVEHQLRDSAGRDSLTGLLNHAAFHDHVSRSLGVHGLVASEVALVLFDMDYLKLLNDSYGHQMGDLALRSVADVLRTTLRESDCIARLGGDEFGALLVGIDRDAVLRIAQRAVTLVCTTTLPEFGRLSVSAGVAFVSSTREPGDLFDRADEAVYDAKSRGRGVVSVADMTEIAYTSRRRDLPEQPPLLPSPELAEARDMITAARGALREWAQVLTCSGGCVDLLDPSGKRVKAVAYYRFGHDDWMLAEQSYELADYPNTANALALGQTYTCRADDAESDPAEVALLRERGFSSLLLTPLISGGRAIGIIELFDTRPRVFTSNEQRVAMALAHHLSPLLRLLQQSDPSKS